jgi:hypothetical protein
MTSVPGIMASNTTTGTTNTNTTAEASNATATTTTTTTTKPIDGYDTDQEKGVRNRSRKERITCSRGHLASLPPSQN